MSPRPRKLPPITVREASIFGDFSEEELQNPARDRFYLPGWSDRRTQYERDLREWERTGKHGKPPASLDFRLQFVSVEKPSGSPDGTKQADFSATGYRPLKWDEASSYGLTLGDAEKGYTAAARPDAQGNVRVGSQVLMVTDAKHAATNLERVRRAQADQDDAIRTRMQVVADDVNRQYGLSAEGGTAFELAEEPEAK